MALPTKSDLITLDYVFREGVFVNVTAKSGIELETLDYAFREGVFMGNPEEELPMGGKYLIDGFDSNLLKGVMVR